MKFNPPLLESKLIRRYNRFLSEHILQNGNKVIAHCPNPGSMLGLIQKGSKTWLSIAKNKKRKLKYTWELINADKTMVGINTLLSNKIVKEELIKKSINSLKDYSIVKEEVKYGLNSRIDFILENNIAPPCYVEVKNVTLSRYNKIAEFPDSITARGEKQLKELKTIIKEGNKAVVIYLIQRNDCNIMKIAKDIDTNYHKTLTEILKLGLEIICLRCFVSSNEITVNKFATLKI